MADDDRYCAFLDAVAKWEGVWALYHNGWLLHRDGRGQTYCPLFATRADAQSFGASIQSDHVPTAITLVELIEGLIAQWHNEGIVPGICPTPSSDAVLVDPDNLSADLLAALKDAITERFGRRG
jgi:hypothetical protein